MKVNWQLYKATFMVRYQERRGDAEYLQLIFPKIFSNIFKFRQKAPEKNTHSLWRLTLSLSIILYLQTKWNNPVKYSHQKAEWSTIKVKH